MLEKYNDCSLIHNGTSHWVKEINTIVIRDVPSNGEIFKVPLFMKKVSGSFTGEMLCTEMIEQISSIKVLQSKNAVDGIKNSNTCKGNSKPEYELKKLHMKLEVRIIYTSFSFLFVLKYIHTFFWFGVTARKSNFWFIYVASNPQINFLFMLVYFSYFFDFTL